MSASEESPIYDVAYWPVAVQGWLMRQYYVWSSYTVKAEALAGDSNLSLIARKKISVCDGVHFKDEVEVPPYQKHQHLSVTNVSTTIAEFLMIMR